jgi:ABC-type transport system involved in cytochrome bd biosynthesis fused ATPase/permease subunit
MRSSPAFLITLLILLVGPLPLRAAEKIDPATQKMREALRNTMIQLRDANAKLATAQAAQTEAEEKNKELQGQLEELTKKSTSEKKTADATIEDLGTKLTASELQVNHLTESLGKWKLGYAKMAEYAKATEGKRAELASKIVILDRRIADQQLRNAEMYRLGNEVLDRYAQFGLGTAISAREPFVGITKVKFQNLVQDYQNKLTDQTIRHDAPSPEKKPD